MKFVDISICFGQTPIKQNVSLIHITYHFMCIMICIVTHKINDIEPY